MYRLLLFLKRRLYFRRKPSEPARLADVLKAAEHAQSQFDALHRGLIDHLRELDKRLSSLESRLDFILGVLDCAAHLDQASRERHERVLGSLEELLHQEIAVCQHDLRLQRTASKSTGLLLQRLHSLEARLTMTQQARARLVDRSPYL